MCRDDDGPTPVRRPSDIAIVKAALAAAFTPEWYARRDAAIARGCVTCKRPIGHMPPSFTADWQHAYCGSWCTPRTEVTS